ncbi:replication initiation and membrane attachment family protein [Oceanobacillus sp. J11TS1]|uniref:replication initiation and membrane attachment family protein n=1 Tax=Oceanobacillus sp. J11TS1 TaxID=2807191 RepID=UPI001B2F5E1B|nr:DnaD domain protein [Oceanobacillus sp. J11TS1]GIO21716.1 replication initiation and membrane attachment protein [Oceanobacillus sp. J11TS1]
MNAIGKILPIDGYNVVRNEQPPIDFNASLTHFYQPLIGIQAISLYYTLFYEAGYEQKTQTHHTLMTYLNLTLDDIYRARIKLEAIGLLKTYKRTEEDRDYYTYSVQSPYSPNQFFREAMLSQLLLHHIGEQKYNELYARYLKDSYPYGEEVTADFNEVFDTITPTLTPVKNIASEKQDAESKLMDFSWIEQSLRQRFIPAERILNPVNKKLIYQMKVLYDLDSIDLEKALLWALNEDNQLIQEEFKSACHDMFVSRNNGQSIRLKEKVVTETKVAANKPATKEEQLINELESISPKQLLEDLSDGNHASEQDIKVVREVMTNQGLPAPVMNVLIHYVLLQSNMKLSKAYMETIASHWSRVGLKTAKEAMTFAKKEQERYKAAKNKQKKNTNYTNNKYKKEVVPDWFKARNSKQPANANDVNISETEQQEIEAKLQKYLSES